jgi:CBS domain-containing protein
MQHLDRPISLILREKGNHVHTVAAQATVYEALMIMAEKGIGALVVLDGEELVGILSERDYARKVALAGRSSKELEVGEIMSTDLHTVGLESTVDECMQHMTDKRCRHLPVLERGKLVGIVSIGDMVHWIINRQESTIHELEDYITGNYPH